MAEITNMDALLGDLLALKPLMDVSRWRATLLEVLAHMGAADGAMVVSDDAHVLASIGLSVQEAERTARHIVFPEVADTDDGPTALGCEVLTLPSGPKEFVLLVLCARSASTSVDVRSVTVEGLPVIALLMRAGGLTSSVL